MRDAMTAGLIDCIETPPRTRTPPGVPWCADNGCFSEAYVGDDAWWSWLTTHPALARCVFAVAPDVVGDAAATLTRALPWLPRIRQLGVPAAFVAQNGIEATEVPWDAFDVLFLGGDDAFKEGPVARWCTADAVRRGKRVHMGRVNGQRRLLYADAIGCSSVDGTFLTFGPDVNLARLAAWLRAVNDQGTLDLELLMTTAHARRGDPYTSHVAAAGVDVPSQRARVYALLEQHGPLTDEELVALHRARETRMHVGVAAWPTASASGLRSRRAELYHDGEVRPVEDPQARTELGGRTLRWEVVPEDERNAEPEGGLW